MMPTMPALAFARDEPATGIGCAVTAVPTPRKASTTRRNDRIRNTVINLSLSCGESVETIRRFGVTQFLRFCALSIPRGRDGAVRCEAAHLNGSQEGGIAC